MNIKKGIEENLLEVKLDRADLVDKITKILMDNYELLVLISLYIEQIEYTCSELLVLISLYIEQIEYTCSQEKLNDFKLRIKDLNEVLIKMTKFQFHDASEKAIQYFVQAFYSALHGIAPACSPFKKQKIAMEKAGIYVKCLYDKTNL